jgi:broad specificity phosphatase PhoE
VLVLVRHGATAANLAVPHVLQGRGLDLSLCDVGIRQAEQVAEFLAQVFEGEPSPALFSSCLKRAVETAEQIQSRLSLRERTRLGTAEAHDARRGEDASFRGSERRLSTIELLHEVDTGRWEGRDYGEIVRNDPIAHQQFLDDPAGSGYPEGETITDVANRVQPIFESLAQQHLGQRIIVVAHNIVLRSYLARVLGIPLSQYRVITQENCCVNVLVWQAGVMSVRTMNSVWHVRI